MTQAGKGAISHEVRAMQQGRPPARPREVFSRNGLLPCAGPALDKITQKS